MTNRLLSKWGLVDADSYSGNFVNFPAQWRDQGFTGVLPKGTPVAQCIPVKRDSWEASFETIGDDAVMRQLELSMTMIQEPGIYRRSFRAPKR